MLNLIHQFRWIDALDILIVACAIYQIILALRGTRAFQMLLGLAFLYVASWVSLRIGLITVNWALSNLLAVWFLLIIILFQPELRRALASVGRRGSLLRAFSRYQEAHMIDEVVRAVASLAAKKIGAIIVVERDSRLTDTVDSGTAVDAMASRRLLESIFFPYSPLHDGAVILSRDRIVAAGCFLPLSINPRLPRDLGTRHRAAVGVTEETDAIAIVVSEETGAISLVMGGEITQHLDASALRQRLGGLLGPPLGSGRQAKVEAPASLRELADQPRGEGPQGL
ncbi:MAG TPA: diadenylate cyclase CdaA [Candidatus Methylomirabilis sp.]|nr:diadenylate cyclase CdaA [Candidatus Methylomirabilis sp.]